MSIATSFKCRLSWDFGEDFGDEPGDFFFWDFGDELGETVTDPAFVVWSVKLEPIDPFMRSAIDLERGERDPALARAPASSAECQTVSTAKRHSHKHRHAQLGQRHRTQADRATICGLRVH